MKSSSIPQIVLTGSSGFLGQHVLHSLIHEPLFSEGGGLQIHALYRGMEGFEEAVANTVSNAAAAANTSSSGGGDVSNNNNSSNTCSSSGGSSNVNVQVHKLDLTNDNDVKDWLQQYGGTTTTNNNNKIDVCIHTAALSVPKVCETDPIKARALNVPKTFLEGLMKQPSPMMMIALSTDQVYDGKIQEGGAYKETDPVNPLNVYGRTKVELEEFLIQQQQQQQQQSNDKNNQLPSSSSSSSSSVVILRSSIILGPQAPIAGDKAHKTFLHFCSTRNNQETTFWTDECRSVVSVQNVIQVIRYFIKQKILLLQNQDQQQSTATNDGGGGCAAAASGKGVCGIYNMGGLNRQSRMDMAKAVFQHFGYAENKLTSAKKADLPPPTTAEVKSPLDITMDSSKLRDLIKDDTDEVKWMKMDEIVQSTFVVDEEEEATGGDKEEGAKKKAKTI